MTQCNVRFSLKFNTEDEANSFLESDDLKLITYDADVVIDQDGPKLVIDFDADIISVTTIENRIRRVRRKHPIVAAYAKRIDDVVMALEFEGRTVEIEFPEEISEIIRGRFGDSSFISRDGCPTVSHLFHITKQLGSIEFAIVAGSDAVPGKLSLVQNN
jgi:hypothetical protein